MAGAVNMARGGTPATPNSNTDTIYPASTSATGPNGENLGGRLLKIDSQGGIAQLSSGDRLNYIRNGGFWFAQRQAPGTATAYTNPNARIIAADGWAISNENPSVTYKRIDTSGAIESGLQSRFYGQFLQITVSGKFVVCQAIEGTESVALRNRTVRFQVWMKATVNSTWRLGLLYLNASGTMDTMPATFVTAFGGASTDPTFGTNVSKIIPSTAQIGDNVVLSSNAFSCSVTTSWQRFGGVWSVPNDCKNLIPAIWSDSQATATNGINIGQASLTDGYEVQDWTPQSYATELIRVRRFYQKSFPVDIAPQQNAGLNTGEAKGIAGKAAGVANSGFIYPRFDVPLRVPGGTTLYNPAAANALMRDVTGAVDMGATSVTANSQSDMLINATGNAATAVGDQVSIHFTSDAEI